MAEVVSSMLSWAKSRLALPPMDLKVMIAGPDAAGKTTLLYTAVRGELAQYPPTIGFNVENLAPLGPSGPHICAWDVGGGPRIGPLYLHYTPGLRGLVFVLRPTDPRVWSALWELYYIVQHAVAENSADLAVCVVVPVHEGAADGHFRLWGGDAGVSLATLARLAERSCLPPGGTARWSRARSWLSSASAGEEESVVDSEWLAAWEKDRQGVLKTGLTGSHGMRARHEPLASPPLASIHSGPWVVLPIDLDRNVADAMLPFRWLASVTQERHVSW